MVQHHCRSARKRPRRGQTPAVEPQGRGMCRPREALAQQQQQRALRRNVKNMNSASGLGVVYYEVTARPLRHWEARATALLG